MNYRIYLNLSGKQPAYTDNTIFVGIDGTVNAHVQGRIVPCTVPSLSENDIKTLIAQQVTGEIDAADVTKIVNAAIEAAGEGVATQDWVIQQIGTLAFEEKDTLAITALNEHIAGDETRWNVTQDLIASTQSKILKTVQEMILGVSLPLDYNQPVTVVGTNGLLSLATNNEWTVPYNGAIQCSAGGALTTAISVMVIRGSIHRPTC